MSGSINIKKFGGLVYREYALAKDTIKLNIIISLLFASLALMALASAQYGNIAKIGSGFPEITVPYARYTGIYVSFSLFFSLDCSKDIKHKTWLLFRKSSPASPLAMSLARTVYMMICFMISVGLSAVFMALAAVICGEPASVGDIGMFSIIAAYVTLLVVSLNIGMTLTGSYDMGGLAGIGICMALTIPVAIPIKKSIGEMNSEALETFKQLMGDNLVLIWAAIILLFAAQTVTVALLYKRRDK